MTLFFNTYINNDAVVGGPYLIDGPLKDCFDSSEYKYFTFDKKSKYRTQNNEEIIQKNIKYITYVTKYPSFFRKRI